MDAKKYLSLVLLGMIIILPLFTTSCFKKGDEDPFFSIYTRKARVTGRWTLSNYESTIKRTYQNRPDQTLTVTKIDGEDWSRNIKILGTDSVVDIKGKIVTGRNTIQYYSDGRFTEILEYEYKIIEADDDSETITIYKVQDELSGTWNFLANIDDYKNKERLSLVIEQNKSKTFVYLLQLSEDDESTPIPQLISTVSSSRKYANGESSTIWTLRMLKNKQIIQDQLVDRFVVETTNGVGDVYTEVGSVTRTLKAESTKAETSPTQ
ncbi:MAG TPA: hypothetical protein PLW77_02555 [Bacteroidales bacterium]|nr:hypothetical protein [Bacteroidales bacterium]HQB20750.1 hypothetical protein [Bacteroidales bacterium]